MKLLLTDSGVSNASILAALVDLLGRPITEARALCIPTAGYGGLYGDPDGPWDFISGQADGPMTVLGWKSVGVLELTALPSIDKERWVSWVREADVLLVNGGDTLYLCYWMQESGLADVFPSLRDTVYVGLSAGSLVLTPRIGEHFASTNPRADGDDSTLGLVDFSIFPHIDSPDRTMADAEQWAAGIKGPAYVTDSQTAIKVTEGRAEVISEGYWKLFNAAVLRSATFLCRASEAQKNSATSTGRSRPGATTSRKCPRCPRWSQPPSKLGNVARERLKHEGRLAAPRCYSRFASCDVPLACH